MCTKSASVQTDHCRNPDFPLLLDYHLASQPNLSRHFLICKWESSHDQSAWQGEFSEMADLNDQHNVI